jgi:protein ImuA
LIFLEHTENVLGKAMPQPVTPSVFVAARNRAVVMEELRRLLPGGIADSRKTLPFGCGALDSCLPGGGLAYGALHEIVPASYAIPAAFGFVAAIVGRLCLGVGVGRFCKAVDALTSPRDRHPFLPTRGRVFFILPAYGLGPYGRLYGHGLRALGLDPACLVLVETARRRDALWAIEETVRSAAPAAIAAIIDKLDLKTSQRLHLFATETGRPLFLLRPAQNLETSAAATRWRVGTAEAARDRFGLITRPRWHLRLERARNGRPGEWVVEYDHVAHRFSLAAALADPARARGTDEAAYGKTHCA